MAHTPAPVHGRLRESRRPAPLRLDAVRHRNSCGHCNLATLCLPLGLTPSDAEALNGIAQRRPPLRRGRYLYRSGDPFRALYAVRAGALKTSLVADSGEEQITGFQLPGDVLGFDGIGTGVQPGSAQALDTTSVCALPFDRLEAIAVRVPGLQHRLFRLLSRQITADQGVFFMLARRTAEERVALVLLSLSERYAGIGLSGSRFRLPMSRSDLGNYVGLAPETVSRVFRRFEEQGCLHANGREIELRDPAGLRALSGRRAPADQRANG